jgi:ParB-like chromosome segregation protein Spo0J
MNPFPAYKAVSVASLVPYARNSRTHSQQQVDKIAASIREFGFLNPIIVDGENGIIAGHGRVMAAQKLGLTDLPVIEASHLTEAQRRAYVIADNRLALDAGWDNELLKVELQDLDAQDFDLTLTGFELGELTSLFDEPKAEDELPEQQDLKATFEVAVECNDETQQETVFNLLIQQGYKCRILTM